MSTDIVASEDAKAQADYVGFENVPKHLKTKGSWQAKFRRVRNGEQPTATVVVKRKARLDCADHEKEIESLPYNLFHFNQTVEIKRTPLNVARQQFWEIFGQTNDRSKLIRWTKGEWIEDGCGKRLWDSTADVWGWKTFGKERFTQPKCVDHDMGREVYGVFGAKNSSYLFIDLDLHNNPLVQFLRRLAVLLVAFHGKYRCHFQVSDEAARGVHLILYFEVASPLKNRIKWFERVLSELDEAFPDCQFFKTKNNGKRVRQIEVYPDPSNPHRLPLARGRTMLLDKPLELVTRRRRRSQDIVGYINWLNDPDRGFMPKNGVYQYIVERLDLSCSSSTGEPTDSQKPTSQSMSTRSHKLPSENSEKIFVPQSSLKETTSENRSYSLKGKTRGAIIGFWKRGEPGHFQNLNSAIYITLMALRAQDCDRKRAVETVMQYVRALPNNNLSSRLPDGLSEIERLVERDSVKVWNVECNGTWKVSAQRWAEIGFRIDDKTSWDVTGKTPEVVVDCEEIEFSDDERKLIVNDLTPLLVGAKQALKPEKQREVERAVAYFLRFVRCCDREIPVHGLPKILAGFKLNLGQHQKQRSFLNKLLDWKWIYLRADYYHPAKHGGKASKGRARSYGIGKAMIGKFTLPITNKKEQRWSYILSSTFCETTGSDIEIPFFDEQLDDMQAVPASFDTEECTDLVSTRLGQHQHAHRTGDIAELTGIHSDFTAEPCRPAESHGSSMIRGISCE